MSTRALSRRLLSNCLLASPEGPAGKAATHVEHLGSRQRDERTLLERSDLTVDLCVAGTRVGQIHRLSTGSWLGRWLGLGPIDIRFRDFVRAQLVRLSAGIANLSATIPKEIRC